MSAAVTQIVKEGSNVLLKDAAGNIQKILASNGTYAHPSAAPNTEVIQFNDSPDRCPGKDSFFILVDNITVPAGAWTQQTLLQELSDNYLNCPIDVNVVGGKNKGATSAKSKKIFAEIPVEAQLIASNADRKEVIISNNANKTVWLCYGGTAVVGDGTPLKKNDIFIEDVFTGEIRYMYDVGTTGNITIQEVTT